MVACYLSTGISAASKELVCNRDKWCLTRLPVDAVGNRKARMIKAAGDFSGTLEFMCTGNVGRPREFIVSVLMRGNSSGVLKPSIVATVFQAKGYRIFEFKTEKLNRSLIWSFSPIKDLTKILSLDPLDIVTFSNDGALKVWTSVREIRSAITELARHCRP